MFEKKTWVNRQSEHPSRRRLTPSGNDNEYDVARAEGLVMEEGDAFDADTMNDLERRIGAGFSELDPTEAGSVNVTVQPYTCVKTGSVYALTGSGAIGRFKVPAAWASGDTFTVNGEAVSAYCGADAVDGDCIVAGRWVLFTFDGTQLNFNGGGGLSASKLAQATAQPSQVLAGVPFYAGGKTLQKGTMRNNGSWPDADKLTMESGKLCMYKSDGYTAGGLGAAASLLGGASASDIMQGVTASSSKGLRMAGSIVDRGNWGTEIAPGGLVTIPAGRHGGGGQVSAKSIKYASKTLDAPGASYSYTITEGTLIGVTGVSLPSFAAQTVHAGCSVWMSGNTIHVDLGRVDGYVTIAVTYAYY